MPLLELRILEIHSIPNFAHDFVLLYYRSSLSFVNLRQFLCKLCPFWNQEYWKYTVFRTFLLNSLTYWAEILHMTLFYCTTDQVRVSSICVNFCWSYAPFGTYNTRNTRYSILFWLTCTCFDILNWNFTYDCFTVLQIKFECRQFASIFVGVMPLLVLRILKIHSFTYFSLTCFDILSWNFTFDFVSLHYSLSWSVINSHQFF